MDEYITIGPCPADEDCAQVGEPNFRARALLETDAFIQQLQREFGPEPEGCYITRRGFPHDFGTYYEVVVVYDPTMPGAMEYALKCEGGRTRWDPIARQALGLPPL